MWNDIWVQTPLKSWLFEASVRNCLNCVQNCDDHGLLDFKSAVQCMRHFIYHFTSIPHGLIRTHKWPAPNVSGLIAQLVRASHRYREVTSSNPVKVLTFSGFCSQLLKLRSKLQWSWLTWVHSVDWFQIRSSIYETFHISLHKQSEP